MDLGTVCETYWHLRAPSGNEVICRLFWNKARRHFHICIVGTGELMHCSRVDSPLQARDLADDWLRNLVEHEQYEDLGVPPAYGRIDGY